MLCVICIECFFWKYICINFQDLFDLSNKQTSKTDISKGEIRSSGEGKITHMCVCVYREESAF